MESATYKLFTTKHKDYEAIKTSSEFMDASYTGGARYVKKYIYQYLNESDLKYRDRIKRAFVVNYISTLVDEINNTIFSRNIQRDAAASNTIDGKKFKRFIDNATYNNKSLDNFMKSISTLGAYERIGILLEGVAPEEVDRLGINPASVSSQVKEKYNLYPRLKIFTPEKILNWSVTDKVNWVLLDYSYDDDSDFENPKKVKKHVLWTNNYFRVVVFSEGGYEIASDETFIHNLGRIPFWFFTQRDIDDNTTSETLYEDIALQQRAICGYYSIIDESIYSSIFSILLVENSDEYPELNESPKMRKEPFTLDKNVLSYAKGTSAPSLLKTDFANIPIVLSLIDGLIKEINRKVGKYLDPNNYFAQSGLAKLVDQEQRAINIVNYAKQLQDLENSILQVYSLYEGIAWNENYMSVYPQDFRSIDVKDKIANAIQLKNIFAARSETAERIILKDIFLKLYSENITEQEKEAIIKEIEGSYQSDIDLNFETEPDNQTT